MINKNSTELTEREKEVLHQLVQGKTNQQIAKLLFVEVSTVKSHLTSIFRKLGATNRTQTIVKVLSRR